eukprot:7175164-Karenia_brevis.AAC.1
MVLSRLLVRHDILCLQETHGFTADFDISSRRFFRSHKFFLSICGQVDKGGVAIFARQGLIKQSSQPVSYTHLTLPTICSV